MGHVLPAITKRNIGELTPADLLGALKLFEHLYMRSEDA